MFKFYNMSFLNFIDTGFIFTLGLILLVGGAILLYCYQRLNVLENSVIEHGKILHNFIANYHNQQTQQPQQTLQRPLNTIHEDMNMNVNEDKDTIKHITGLSNKIVVSDEEDSDSDEEDSDNDDDSDDNEEDDKLTIDSDERSYTGDKDDPLFDVEDVKDITDFTPSMFENMTSNTDISLDTFSKIINLEEDTEKPKFTKMKVDELREYVVSHNYMSNPEAAKLKKLDLIKILQEETSMA